MDINAVSVVNLVMAVGLSVEFLVHVSAHYSRSSTARPIAAGLRSDGSAGEALPALATPTNGKRRSAGKAAHGELGESLLSNGASNGHAAPKRGLTVDTSATGAVHHNAGGKVPVRLRVMSDATDDDIQANVRRFWCQCCTARWWSPEMRADRVRS